MNACDFKALSLERQGLTLEDPRLREKAKLFDEKQNLKHEVCTSFDRGIGVISIWGLRV